MERHVDGRVDSRGESAVHESRGVLRHWQPSRILWRSAALGINLAEDAFPDHHIYTVREIQQLAERARGKGASALVTTQKDAVKISRGWRLELPIHYCEIEARISEAGESEKSILAVFEKAE